MQNSTRSTYSGFLAGASNVNASHGTFTDIAGDHININVNSLNENEYLDKLPRSKSAGYRCGNHRTCLEGTRLEVLQEIMMWEKDLTDELVYWLKGPAGSGKSTIAQTFAERSAADGCLGASFFCSRDFPDRRNLQLIFPTLAYDLAYKSAEFKSALIQIMSSNPSPEHFSLAVQLEMLIARPLKETRSSFTIVVDALDECEDKEPVSAFLSALARYIDEIPTIKFFITGRPEDHIRYGFMKLWTKELPLHDVESAAVDSDIKSYLLTELKEITARRVTSIHHGSWPSDKEVDAILERCSGLFIIASAITRFIDYPYAAPQDRLKLLLNMANGAVYERKSGIDAMYYQILVASFKNVDEDDSEFFDEMHLVVGSIVLAFTPLSIASLAKILKISSERIRSILSHLHSVLIVPNSNSHDVRICHKSFSDFITTEDRCRDKRYWINAPAHHLELGALCLELMNARLMKNICRLPRYVMNADVADLPSRREEYIGVPLAYACSSWAKHLRSSLGSGADIGSTIQSANYLLEGRFLPWLEVLSVEGEFHIAVYALHDVRSWLTDAKSSASSLCALVDDCERFVLKFFDVMEQSAMHIYHSALPWTPSSSIVRRFYDGDLMMEAKLVNAVDDAWNGCIREISVNDIPRTIMFSRTGALITIHTGDNMLLFDSMTGVERASFDTPGRVCSIDFSPDDSLVMLARFHSIYFWDVQTGNIVQEFTDVGDVAAFSPCGTMIASPYGGTIRIWNVTSGRCDYVLAGHALWVLAVCWSANGDQVVTGSGDGTVRVWEVSEGAVPKILFIHTEPVTAVASSKPHGSFLVASASKDKTVKVFDLRSGDVIHTFSSSHLIDSVRFSLDGEKIMYASNNLGYIWDLARKTPLSSIYYDGAHPAFSPDGTYIASTVKDKGLVRIWKQSERGHEHDGADSRDRTNDPIIDISLSPDGHLVATLATTTDSMLVKFWDVTMDTCLSVFNGDIVKDYPCPSCSVIFSANSMFIAFWSMPMFGSEDTVWIWNVHTHSLVKSIKVELDAHHIALSSDGGRLASVSRDDIIIWDLVLERPIARSEYQYPSVDSYSTPFRLRVDFTVDGNTILITNRNRIDYWCISPASALSPSPFELPMALVHMPSWSCHDQSSSYYEQDGWIVRQDLRRMLWIPPDKRTQMTDSHGEKIIIWSLDGKLYIVDFSSVSLS